jgi:hypothetical protein
LTNERGSAPRHEVGKDVASYLGRTYLSAEGSDVAARRADVDPWLHGERAAASREKGRIFDLHLQEYERAGLLRIMTLPGHDLEADCVAEMLREDIEWRGVRRLVIGSAAQLERSIVDVDQRSDFFAALVTDLRGADRDHVPAL